MLSKVIAYMLILAALMSPARADDETVVCVLDSGCNAPDAQGESFLGERDDIADNIGHGTLIMSLIEANAPDARVVMLKCFDDANTINASPIASAIRAAVDEYSADIINMSWTVREQDDELHAAVIYALESGCALVASAGNLSFQTGLGATVYPASWDGVIGVAGVNVNADGEPESSLWYLSGDCVYVCARADCAGGKGSSYACARVSAFLANMESCENPFEALKGSAKDAGDAGYDVIYGWGYIETAE